VIIRVPKEKPSRGFRNLRVRFPALAPRSVAPYLAGMKLTDAIKKIFRRRHADETAEQQPPATPQPLRIEGVKPAPLTPEPDDAELAAQALLESMAERPTPNPSLRGRGRDTSAAEHSTPRPDRERLRVGDGTSGMGQGGGSAAYYHALADRIRSARTAEARLTMRLLASVEEQLSEPTALYRGQWGDTERKLYHAIDIAEREGGELHRRWQHCLANVIVRRMEEEREEMEDGRRKMEDGQHIITI